jgi:hypothetical protein
MARSTRLRCFASSSTSTALLSVGPDGSTRVCTGASDEVPNGWTGCAITTRCCSLTGVWLRNRLDNGSRMTRECHVRLCVQRKLACSAGDRPAGAKVRSSVARIAGWRETKTLKPIDRCSFGEYASHRAVMKVNVNVASKVRSPEGRACNCRAKAAWVAEI